ncbi:3-isopropylmalate dehydratase small subunit [Aliishimia ponticola]|uniref:3-isopropylmalate dehydratase n=1 Tax=Aliishimia ponticola TaxID=2499833 RepID=A0A4S4NCB9_9RHOB|nr:3-isopropylmalate dehydratase small subunit [Aliishimia ponticola]THH36117.1 3-isopropylmalate dehydratase small subunit [Aliishimia ponticola]
MAGWTVHTGTAVALPLANVDTDQLIPARFMSAPRSEGYGSFLLHDTRRDEDGALRPDFPLNRHPEANIMITRENFGSGSSREAAVYALIDAGFRAVIAPAFGDIFASNAVNNGLLPARLTPEACAQIEQMLGDGTAQARIDLDQSTLTIGAQDFAFDLDASWRIKLINGWDDIDLTRQHAAQIAQFRNNRSQAAPWAWPGEVD